MTVLREIDPLLRFRVRKKLVARLSNAAFTTSYANDDAHLCRLAYLQDFGGAVNPDEIEEVTKSFEEQIAEKPPRKPWRGNTSLTVLGLLGAAVGAALFFTFAPDHWLDRSLEAESGDAFEHGGRPEQGDSEVRELFDSSIHDFAHALRQQQPADPNSQGLVTEMEANLHEAATEALGSDSASFLQAVTSQARSITGTQELAPQDSFIRSVDAFNDSLAQQGIGKYLDAAVVFDGRRGANRVAMSTFTVERVSFFQAGDERIKALRLSRRDARGFNRAVLGFTRPQIRDALVLLEPIDAWIVESVLPALVEEGSLRLYDAETRDGGSHESVMSLERGAADEVRRSAFAVGGDRQALEKAGAAILTRRQLFADWTARFASRLRIRLPRYYELDLDSYEGLEDLLPNSEWRELSGAQSDLAEDDVLAAYRRLRESMVRSIERHEVQHRLDYTAGDWERVPDALVETLGPSMTAVGENIAVHRAMSELSAYLSELARSPELVKINVSFFASRLLNRRAWGTVECYAALAVFEGLADRIGLGSEPLSGRGVIYRRNVRRVLEQLLALRDQELSDHARGLWEESVGRPLAEITPVGR